MIAMGVLLFIAWVYYLMKGQIEFMKVRIPRETQSQKYWTIQGIILMLAIFCIWVQWGDLMNALRQSGG